MKELVAAVTSLLALLGITAAYQPTTDAAALQSSVAAELVYASFTPVAEPAPAPEPKQQAAAESAAPAVQETLTAAPASPAAPSKPPAKKPPPQPAQPVAVWQQVWVRDGRFRGHWEWRLYYQLPQARRPTGQRSTQTYYRGSCTGGLCR